MPRTIPRNTQNKRQRNSNDSGYEGAMKEMDRIADQFKNKSSFNWQKRRDQISKLFDSYRSKLGEKLNFTIDELINGKPIDNTDSMSTISQSSESSVRSNRPVGPLASSGRSRRRSKSANATTTTASASGGNSSRIVKKYDSNNQRASRSKFRNPANRLQTMSADRSVMNPVIPKIQMNTPFSMLRYPKIGETIISMSGSPIIANGGAMHNTANINIPTATGVFSMNPTPFSEVDSNIVPRIDEDTLVQLKQLQDNLALVMSNWSKN